MVRTIYLHTPYFETNRTSKNIFQEIAKNLNNASFDSNIVQAVMKVSIIRTWNTSPNNSREALTAIILWRIRTWNTSPNNSREALTAIILWRKIRKSLPKRTSYNLLLEKQEDENLFYTFFFDMWESAIVCNCCFILAAFITGILGVCKLGQLWMKNVNV